MIMRFPGGKSKAFTMSYDDGFEPDIRLMDILKRYGIKGTFNLNSGLYGKEYTVCSVGKTYCRMSKEKTTELFAESGMEIAVHGYKHEGMKQLPSNLCTMEVVKDRINLENQFQRLVRGMAYAGGGFNEQIIECLKCCGIAYARTTISTGDFRLPSDWYQLSSTCHHKDKKLMDYAHKFVEEEARKDSWLFYVWGHSYELDADNSWEQIEHFAEYIGGRDTVWYATNIEIYDYIKAYQALIFSMDGRRVYNPTALEVFFEMDGENIRIAPGETIKMG